MKKSLFYLLTILSFSCSLFAHTLLITDFDNEDGTMDVMGGFSTGQTAQGAMVIIESKASSEVLFKQRVPSSGSITIKVPTEPYIIVLDAGQGHRVTKEGNIKPQGGFVEKKGLFANINIPFYLTLFLSLFFTFSALILSFYKRKRFNKSIAA